MGQTNDTSSIDEKGAKQHDSIEKNIGSYSFSYNFNYWSSCKTSKHRIGGVYIRDNYIEPKYKCLKDELLNNDIETIDLNTWITICLQADQQMKTIQFKNILARFKTSSVSGVLDNDPIHYGYKN
eukprot:119832_1